MDVDRVWVRRQNQSRNNTEWAAQWKT
jgi:hypothetical protein